MLNVFITWYVDQTVVDVRLFSVWLQILAGRRNGYLAAQRIVWLYDAFLTSYFNVLKYSYDILGPDDNEVSARGWFV